MEKSEGVRGMVWRNDLGESGGILDDLGRCYDCDAPTWILDGETAFEEIVSYGDYENPPEYDTIVICYSCQFRRKEEDKYNFDFDEDFKDYDGEDYEAYEEDIYPYGYNPWSDV